MINWVLKNRRETVAIIIIFLLAVYFRFYRLSEYMTFLGDEGRDAIVVKNLLVNHHFPSLGPVTSVGNMYLGPLYYYMMALPMAVWWLNPIAATAMVALIGVAAVLLIYYLSRVWFGFWPAVLSSLAYAISPVNIIYSRSSWNPNPAPFFALLAILGFYRAHQSKNFLWIVLSGIGAASALQMHYLAIILIPIFGLLWLYELSLKIKGERYHFFVTGTIVSVAVFFSLMVPLVLFDLKHNFMNYRAFIALFSKQEGAVNLDIFSGFAGILPIYFNKLIGRYLGGENIFATLIVAFLVVGPLLVSLKQKIKDKVGNWPYLALGVWLLVGLLGVSFYKQAVYDHYLGFLNPAPFLLLGSFIVFLTKKFQMPAALILIGILLLVNLPKNPLLFPPGNQLTRTQKIAQFVISQSNNKPFNFALISKNNYDSAYQYYLDLYGHKPKVVPIETTDQLFVVCEDPICQPVGHPKYEIAGFGWAKIDKEYIVDGVKVYKLIENPEGRIWQKNSKN